MSSATSVSASAMAATSSAAAAAAPPPCRLLGSGQAHLRLPPAAASGRRRRLLIRCSASGGNNGKGGGGSGSDPVLEERRRRRQAELAARIASGEFTAQGPASVLILSHVAGAFPSSVDDLMESSLSFFRWIAPLAAGLAKLGPPGELAAALLTKVAGGGGPEIPQAVGSMSAVTGQAFFIPLYDLFLTYGGIFRLNFGPKVMRNQTNLLSNSQFFVIIDGLNIVLFLFSQSFLIVSDPAIAKHILRDNSKAYSKVCVVQFWM